MGNPNERCIELHSRAGAHAVRIELFPTEAGLVAIAYSPDCVKVTERISMTVAGALLVADAIEQLIPVDALLERVLETSAYAASELVVQDDRDGDSVMILRINELSPWIHLLSSGGNSVRGSVSLPIDLAFQVIQALRRLCSAP